MRQLASAHAACLMLFKGHMREDLTVTSPVALPKLPQQHVLLIDNQHNGSEILLHLAVKGTLKRFDVFVETL